MKSRILAPWARLALPALGLLAACSRSPLASQASQASQDAGPSLDADADAASGDAVRRELSVLFARGASAARRVEQSCGRDRDSYLETRQTLLASLHVWRRAMPSAADLVFGAPSSQDEAAGALGALDQAMAMQPIDCQAIRKQTRPIDSALRIALSALEHGGVTSDAFATALSDSAYDLGQALLESTAYVPEGDDAAFADVVGLLDGIQAGLSALRVDASEALAPFARLEGAHSLFEVRDRAALVRATGVLGARIRATAFGKAPLVTEPAAEEVSVLDLPGTAASVDLARAALGERLFSDPRLSRGAVRSCASCHVASKAYQDGLVVPTSLVPGTALHRNTPTLLYTPLAALLTWDGRIRTADRQALSVIHTDAEMGLGNEELTSAVASDPAYASAFLDLFARDVTAADIGVALAAFEARTFVVGRAPIDRFAKTGSGLSDDARAGLDVFAGKGRCARCHVPPLWGGSRPPQFDVAIFSALGVPTAPDSGVLDPDLGRGAISHRWADAHAFKVPTLRNVARTAPYFHHGAFPTLDEIIAFYDKGGGAGVGLRVPNQDPEIRPLHLSAEDKRLLLVFLREALSDAR